MGLRVLAAGAWSVCCWPRMLASSMASLSAHNHIITGIFAKDLYQGYLRKDASDRHMLTASRLTSLGVGVVMICVALLFAQGATGIFTLLVYSRVDVSYSAWSATALRICCERWTMVVGCVRLRCRRDHVAIRQSLFESIPGDGIERNVSHWIPAITTTIAFFIPVLLIAPEGEFARRVDSFFAKLKTPVDTGN
jgi:hypothetical protein